MQTIGKVKLLPAMFQTIKVPYATKLLSIQISDGFPYLIVLVPNVDDKELIERKISTYPTGMKLQNGNRVYIGSVQLSSTDKMIDFHIFEEL